MNVLASLDYHHRSPNPLQYGVRKVAASHPGAWLLSRVLRHLDGFVLRATGERTSLTAMAAGLPVVMLSTTGARTGRRRTIPLMGIPYEGTIAVAGANFGQPDTPGWVHNLAALPDAEVRYRGRALKVTARPATEAESVELADAATVVYPPSAGYARRAAERGMRVFILEGTRYPSPSQGP